MEAIEKLRELANKIDWYIADNHGIQYDLRKIANEMEAENSKLRELVSLMDERDVLLPCMSGCNANCRFYSGDMCRRIGSLMRETGIEVDN